MSSVYVFSLLIKNKMIQVYILKVIFITNKKIKIK